MPTLSMRALTNVAGTAYTPSDTETIFAEDWNDVRRAIALGEYGLWTESVKVGPSATERISSLGVAKFRDTTPDADNLYKLGTGALRWQELHAVSIFGDGSGMTGILPSPTSGKYLRANGSAWLAATLDMDDAGAGTLAGIHGGTDTGTILAGDLLLGQAGNWTNLAIGAADRVLRSDGSTAAWSTISRAMLPPEIAYEDEASNWTAPQDFNAQVKFFSSMFLPHRSASGTFSVLSSDCVLSITAVPSTLNLPAAASMTGRFLVVKDSSGAATGANRITLDPDGAETIDGAATKDISSAWGSLTVYCTGTAWRII